MPNSFGNSIVKTILRSPLHPVLGKSLAIITVKGQKTGHRYSTPINVIQEDEGYVVISFRRRMWWRNLRAGATGWLHRAGKEHAVKAEVLEHSQAVREGLTAHFIRHPNYAKHFDVRFVGDGQPNSDDINRLVQERVIIRLREI
jgi:deazaflavin-dependent oxidoreductase (nitroreductase family)